MGMKHGIKAEKELVERQMVKGCFAVRSCGSHGTVDVVSVGPDDCKGVFQVKATSKSSFYVNPRLLKDLVGIEKNYGVKSWLLIKFSEKNGGAIWKQCDPNKLLEREVTRIRPELDECENLQ